MKYLVYSLSLFALFSAGCQHFESQPPTPHQYLEDWKNRSLSDDALRDIWTDDTGGSVSREAALEINLAQAQRVARVFNPKLNQLRLETGIPLAEQEYAGLLKDPVLSTETLYNLVAEKHPWILGASLALRLPLSDIQAAHKKVAEKKVAHAFQRLKLEIWNTDQQVAMRWYAWSLKSQQISVRKAYLSRLKHYESLAQKLVELGELDAVEGRLFQVEARTQAAEILQAEYALQGHYQEILALLGFHPDATITLQPELEATALAMQERDWEEKLLLHPRILLAKAAFELAEADLYREIQDQYPDLEIGPKQGEENAERRLGGVFSLELPLWNRNQQAIAMARAARDAAEAACYAALEDLTHDYWRQKRSLESSRALRMQLEESVLPLLDQQVREFRALSRFGEIEPLEIMVAFRAYLDHRLRYCDAQREELQAAYRLDHLLRPPETTAPPTE